MDEEEKKRLEDIVNDLDKELKMPPYDTNSKKGYSREYQKYKKEERVENEDSSYEKFCMKMGGLLKVKAGESTKEKLNPPLKLLGWDITPGMVLSASIGLGFISFFIWFIIFAINAATGFFIPVSIMFISMFIPIGIGLYTYYLPAYEAKNKVIESSGEMILAILYMVIYMRSSPNIEGAIRFAALNLEGPISKDLKGVLWDLEVGRYEKVDQALQNYTIRWKDYNDDFLESLQLLKAAVNEPNRERRDSLLQDSIDRILDGTQEKMKHYAQGLKTPVMIINAMGAMLPVLGMIMLPLISVFMGDAITIMHLVLLFNIMLPLFLFWFMQRVLSSRPPTVSSQPTSKEEMPKKGRYNIQVFDKNYSIPVWPLGVAVFVIIAFYGVFGYAIFPEVYPVSDNTVETPSIFLSGDEHAPFPMLVRSLSITSGLGLAIGITLYLGGLDRRKAQKNLEKIERQFPTALFQLGNKISGGTPAEVALQEAEEATSELEISGLFSYAVRNINEAGMTFEEAVFSEKYGALRQYPSQMINTVMRAILQSSEKGTRMASMAMMTISRYLENIHKTQEQLNDLMEETTTTIQMLAYLLAPIVSGVAVGMSQTIITSMYRLSMSVEGDIGGGDVDAPEADQGMGGFDDILGLDSAISPELLQFVVGIYLIQLLWILGAFYTKIQYGENETVRNMFTGKILISGVVFYALTLIVVGLLFGGIVTGVTDGV